jgi:hypothetical protein
VHLAGLALGLNVQILIIINNNNNKIDEIK